MLSGKLSDSTAKLLEDMAKRSGLALKQINEVRGALLSPRDILSQLRFTTTLQLKQASSCGHLPPSRLHTQQSQQPMVSNVSTRVDET
jgi:hypothetical protein